MEHHEIFSRFQPFSGDVPAFWQADFLGTKIRQEFVAGLSVASEPTFVTTSKPAADEEYFEWIDLLESAASARDSYTMIDLGAGYGRWAVRAAFAVRQLHGSMPYHLIAVEAEPTVFEWLNLHFTDNGLDPRAHSLIHGAASGTDQEVMFYIGGPRGGPYDRSPDNWYGQALTQDYDTASKSEPDGFYKGHPVLRHASGWRSIRVPGIRLTNLLRDQHLVDLIDMDIEGQELPVIRSAIAELNAKVKRLHIGTHGKEIEAGLRELLSAHGWHCRADYTLFTTSETPWGPISFENGAQSWVNPRLR